MKSRRIDIRGKRFTVPDLQEGERRKRIDMFMDDMFDVVLEDMSVSDEVLMRLRRLAVVSFPGHTVSVDRSEGEGGCDEVSIYIHGPTLNVGLFIS